jgi:hydrogenase expression/formation protein HypE
MVQIQTIKMDKIISLNQGSGGRLTHELIEKVFSKRFGMPEPLTDSAILGEKKLTLAFTTDSYVIDPLFFPGGNIGKLAVCGTVNDLAVSGADPEYLSASFIIEEGFPVKDLVLIAESMAEAALEAGVKIVTGDTKVVDRGKCDKLFITTSGVGILTGDRGHISTGERVKPGDKVIINGPLGNHAIAVLGARKNLSFTAPVISDCASLNHLIKNLLGSCTEIRFMRDVTRGGLSAVLNELAIMTKSDILINENMVPVEEPVRGVCEILGFDPLSLANEGKVLIVSGEKESASVLELMRSHPLGRDSEIIGEILTGKNGMVTLNTFVGGSRILDMPSGQQFPRIC